MLLHEFLFGGYWFRSKQRPTVVFEAFSDSDSDSDSDSVELFQT